MVLLGEIGSGREVAGSGGVLAAVEALLSGAALLSGSDASVIVALSSSDCRFEAVNHPIPRMAKLRREITDTPITNSQ